MSDNDEMYYRHFTESDVDLIIPGEAFNGVTKEMFRDSYRGRTFVGYTVVLGDEIVAILVMSFLWSGVADVTTMISDTAREMPVTFHKIVSAALDANIKHFSVHRVQALVKSDFPRGKKWLMKLGFNEEGIMRKFIKGEDYCLMARITE